MQGLESLGVAASLSAKCGALESQLAGRISSRHIKIAKESRARMKTVNGYYAMGEPPPYGDKQKGDR